jgi:hypothetical protein
LEVLTKLEGIVTEKGTKALSKHKDKVQTY